MGEVSLVGIGEKYKPFINALNVININTIEMPKDNRLSKAVNNHCDMIFHHLGSRKIIVSGTGEHIKELEKYGFEVDISDSNFESNYPLDIFLNAARIDNFILCNKKYTDKKIAEYCIDNNIEIIDVKQGYTKCSVCIVSKDSIITSDSSIVKALKGKGVNILEIRSGYIELSGLDTGFIGGTSGLISKNTLAFCGAINKHPDFDNIRDFCRSQSVYIEEITNLPLTDIGGIIPLKDNL